MLHRLPHWVCLLVICPALGLAGPVCTTTTLDNYEALSSGCTIGSLTVKDFTYSFVSGSATIPNTSITVTPSIGSNTLGLIFSSPDFSVTGSASAVYLLAYTWDPGDIRSLEDILNANSPVFPGLAKITTVDCEDAAFSGSSCGTSTDMIVVSDNGVTLSSPVSVSFAPPVGTLGMRNTIELDGNGASSQFTSFENLLTVPEPSTIGVGLLIGLLLFGRLRLKGL